MQKVEIENTDKLTLDSNSVIINGVYFSSHDFNKLIINKISPKELFAITNQGQKNVLIMLYGYEKLFSNLPGIKIIDKLERQNEVYTLFSWDFSESIHPKLLSINDSASNRKYFTDIHDNSQTVFEALKYIAHTGVTFSEYLENQS